MNPKFILSWLGISAFESLMIASFLLIYLLVLTIRLTTDLLSQTSWWLIHSPLFICDACWAYFGIIVLIRQLLCHRSRAAVYRALWSNNQILLLFLFKLLLCFRLEGQKQITHSEILSPLAVLSILLIVRACQCNT